MTERCFFIASLSGCGDKDVAQVAVKIKPWEPRLGQIQLTHSVSAGLDYAAVGPEHAWLRDQGRVEYTYATDDQALEAFVKLARLEGIIPALESAHAIAEVIQCAPKLTKDKLIIVNLSGRGDKDVTEVAEKVRLEMPD